MTPLPALRTPVNFSKLMVLGYVIRSLLAPWQATQFFEYSA